MVKIQFNMDKETNKFVSVHKIMNEFKSKQEAIIDIIIKYSKTKK